MKRVLLAFVFLLALAVAAWGALPTVTLEAKYTDNGTPIDIANITPYREVEFTWLTVADTPSITYDAFVHGRVNGNVVHNVHEQGALSANVSPITYSLKVTFQSLEEGEISFFPKDANDMTGASQHNFKAIYGTPPTVNVTGVKIAEGYFGTPATSIDLEIELDGIWGNEKNIVATVEPENATNQNVTWASDNEAVATVNNGRVEAKGPGKANITVTTEDGGFTATCVVTVTREGAISIDIEPSTVSMTVGETRTIWVNFGPYLGDGQAVSVVVSPEIATATEAGASPRFRMYNLVADKAGTATLTASVESAAGGTIAATCDISIKDTETPPPSDTPPAASPDVTPPISPVSPDITQPDTTPTPIYEPDTDENTNSGGSGGGCNAGFLGLAALAALASKKKN